jgi:hypothetical protein
VPFAISMGGSDFTADHTFTYVKCPSGCSDVCVAESCRCDEGKFGSECQHDCESAHTPVGLASVPCLTLLFSPLLRHVRERGLRLAHGPVRVLQRLDG